MSIERIGLIIGMIAAALMAAESVVNRFDRIEKRLESPLTLPSRPTRIARWILRYRERIAVCFFAIGYAILLASLDFSEPATQDAARYAIVGFPFMIIGFLAEWIEPRLARKPRNGFVGPISTGSYVIGAILLAPFWITSALTGAFLLILVSLLYFLAFPLFLSIRGVYWLKRKKLIKGVFSTIGFVLLGVSFLLQFVTTP